MNLPKIAPDDLMLFGSLALAAVGAAIVVAATTTDAFLAVGVALIAFALPCVLIVFMAASEETK